LKPQNIMQERQGRILVMDFGLARSLESGGMTQTGALPKVLSDILSKCLERDLSARCQNAQEILSDLYAWQGKRPMLASVAKLMPVPAREVPWKWIAAATPAVAVAIGGWTLRGEARCQASKH